MNKWYIWVVALVVVVAGLFVISWIMKPHEVSTTVSPTSGPVAPAVAADLATYTNAKGQQWSIPKTGGDAFTVASQAVYPQFISGDVDPVDVGIGETQHMAFVIRDNVPITKAWAEVENDKSTDNIPLALGTSSAVSYNDIQNQKYLVDSTGKLVVNDSVSKDSKVADLIQSLFQKAEAEQAMDYSYAGSWVVHDTRTINYHTTFYVEDNLGRTAEAVLVWSDPCTVLSGVLQGACSLTIVWGLDGTGQNLAIGNNTLSLVSSTPATLVYNNGNSISFVSGSKILIGTGTEIVKANLYYQDQDGDRYAPNANMVYSTATSANTMTVNGYNYERVSYALGTNDCYDYNANVYPGQTGWFTSNRGDGSFDYSCSYATTYYNPSQTANGQCDSQAGELCPYNYTPNGKTGFTQTVACGSSGNYVTYPGNCGGGGVIPQDCTTITATNNCTASQTAHLEYTQTGKATTYVENNCTTADNGAPGWSGSVPACGVTANYITDYGTCNTSNGRVYDYATGQLFNNDTVVSQTQACD